MTRLQDRLTKVKAETNAVVRGRPLIVLLETHEIIIRQKGKRLAYAVPYLALWDLGAKLAAIEQRRLKAEKRKAK